MDGPEEQNCANHIISKGSQLWKLKDKMLQNKEGFWMSDEQWNFKKKDDLIYIENINKTKVLETMSDGKVILEDFEEDKAEQLWEKGEPNAEGYFTLENYKVSKFLTVASSTNQGGLEPILDLKGNITL